MLSVVESLDMAKQPRPKPTPKEQVSLTLSAENLAVLRDMAAAQEYPPSLSQVVDVAIKEFIERRKKLR